MHLDVLCLCVFVISVIDDSLGNLMVDNLVVSKNLQFDSLTVNLS